MVTAGNPRKNFRSRDFFPKKMGAHKAVRTLLVVAGKREAAAFRDFRVLVLKKRTGFSEIMCPSKKNNLGFRARAKRPFDPVPQNWREATFPNEIRHSGHIKHMTKQGVITKHFLASICRGTLRLCP